MKHQRQAGILMPISALPSPYGIGTLGDAAVKFVDWLAAAGMHVWQALPLLPTGYGDSPYQSSASGALNPYFIDLDYLAADGLLTRSDYAPVDWGRDVKRVDYGKLFVSRIGVLKKAFARFDRSQKEFQDFLTRGDYFDFALFMSIKAEHGYRAFKEWGEWSRYLKSAAESYAAAHKDDLEFWQFTQYLFLKQWKELKAYAHAKGISLMGDMPIYVSEDSVEMWKYGKELFMLDKAGNPALVAGVPPDAFSEDGQLWGNPVYDWHKMKKTGYRWWLNRIKDALSLFDSVRIDHFRGFDRFYAIPAGSVTAKEGEWLDGPKAELFEKLKDANIVAEDLGIIDDGVRELLKATGYPGMKVLSFGLDSPNSEHNPIEYKENIVAYTGTHDNAPLKAVLEEKGQTAVEELKRECALLEIPCKINSLDGACKAATELLFASKAETAILPMQDVLCLGKESRINEPSTISPLNWSYRFQKSDFRAADVKYLRSLVEKYRRM